MEQKPIVCRGRDFSGHLQYYLNYVGVKVLPEESQNTKEFYNVSFRDNLSVSSDSLPKVTCDDNNAINIKFSYRNFKIFGDSIVVKAMDDNSYILSFCINELENGGFKLTVKRDGEYRKKQTAVVTVNVDLLNNVDILVGRNEDKVDHRIRIPAGKSEYNDASWYLNGIFDTLRICDGYSEEELRFLRLPFHDPRLLSRLNELIEKIPSDIIKAAEEKIAEIEAETTRKISIVYADRDEQIKQLNLLREKALKLRENGLESIGYLEGRKLKEYSLEETTEDTK